MQPTQRPSISRAGTPSPGSVSATQVCSSTRFDAPNGSSGVPNWQSCQYIPSLTLWTPHSARDPSPPP
jgi:hypothetical protein